MIPRTTALLDQARVLAGNCLLRHKKFWIEVKSRNTATRPGKITLGTLAMNRDLWAFDFDGVVCNSVGESSKSAWKVRRQRSFSFFNAAGEASSGRADAHICRHQQENGQSSSASLMSRQKKQPLRKRCVLFGQW
jgi:hypothetical protein